MFDSNRAFISLAQVKTAAELPWPEETLDFIVGNTDEGVTTLRGVNGAVDTTGEVVLDYDGVVLASTLPSAAIAA